MNRTLKRVLGLAGSVALGVVGAVAIGSAAQAHHVEVEWSSECVDDGWVVTWEVTDWNSRNGATGTITKVTADGELSGDIVEGAVLPHPDSDEKLVATQKVGNDVAKVSLKIDAQWDNKNFGSGQGEAFQPEGGCEQPVEHESAVAVSAASDCFGIGIVSSNENPDKLAEITYVPSDGEAVSQTPAVGEQFVKYFPVSDFEAGLSVQVLVDGEEYDTYQWTSPGNCEWGYIYDTCEGLEFELTIPEDGTETTFTFTPSEGDEVVETVAPGETKTVTFTATGDELTVSYVIDDGKNFYEGEVPWEKPEDCEETPVPSESPTPEAQLPTTGSSMTIMISAAAALVLAAAVLFLIARRRRAAADW